MFSVYFIYGIFKDTVSNHILLFRMNQKECARQQLWPNFMFYPSIFIEGLRNVMKSSVRMAGVWAKISS
jgi:hypothetical protein